MNEFLTVKTDVSDVVEALSGTSKSLVSIKKQALGIIARGANKKIKAALRTSTEQHTGKLLKAQVYHVRRDGSEVNLYPRAYGKQNWAVGLTTILNYGSENVGRGRNGVIKPRAFIEAGEDYIDSGSYDRDLEKMVDKQLKKYWG